MGVDVQGENGVAVAEILGELCRDLPGINENCRDLKPQVRPHAGYIRAGREYPRTRPSLQAD